MKPETILGLIEEMIKKKMKLIQLPKKMFLLFLKLVLIMMVI